MPLSAQKNLDEFYVIQPLLQAEASRLEDDRDALDAAISDLLERDLQR